MIKDFIPPDAKELKGDGTWPFKAYIVGFDICLYNVEATCFGGTDDPQDNGETASGASTKNPITRGVSLPMDARGRQMSARLHKVLDGCPIPWLPWQTQVQIIDLENIGKIQTASLIDVGPGKKRDNAVDLTVAVAKCFNQRATATNFSRRVNVRILGAARYVKKG